ncbi:MAG TPA: protein phosphatase CheZ [Desulfurivibrionaceae bacterium]
MTKINDSLFEKNIASLVEITDALLRGDYKGDVPEIDAEGVLSLLAKKINAMLVTMKTVQVPLANAGEQAPFVLSSAQDVVQLMEQSTGAVLDTSDRIVLQVESLENMLRQSGGDSDQARAVIVEIKAALFDIIASQSYQDVARQKMEKIVLDLNQIRDWLIEVLVIFNIKKDGSLENLEKKKELLRGVHAPSAPSSLKQDLVDDLLSEFGF